MKYIPLLFALLLTATVSPTNVATAQDIPITQSIRGTVVDLDTQAPLIGVNVIVLDTNPLKGTSSDVNGRFAIMDVPVGRATLQVTYIGYEPLVLSDMLITAGKELILALELQESVIETEGVVVVADEFEGVAVNEMATVSARSFSVEQTQRYAASISDPARMAQTFAGVTGGGDDLLNDIVVRGNAPKGLLWRLEGIEVPNPNHFGGEGASGGGVSMLSSSTLSRSDFFTGAFPAEYGNAASGVFDLFLRNGNAVKREYAFQIGVLGIDAAIEGPFSADYNGSFLINYRYSTLGVLNNFGVLPEESIQYQDLSFKFNFPTQKGNSFTLFGLGGDAQDIYGSAVADSSQWVDPIDDAINGKYAPRVGILGASYLHLLGPNTYIKAIGMISGERRTDDELLLIPSEDYRGRVLEQQDTRNAAYRASLQLNHKFNARQTLQVGVVGSRLSYNLVDRIRDGINGPLINFLDQQGSTNMLNSHVQLKLRPSARLTLTPGVHYTYFAFNKNHSIEPRVGAAWRLSETQTLSFGVGLHTRTESTALYLAERTNAAGQSFQPHRDLDLMKAWHYVVGYDHYFTPKFRLRFEAYYQDLFDIPVSSSAQNPIFSSINAEDAWDIVFSNDILVNEGTGENYGVELTLEKFLSKGYYYLLTGSLYESRYTPLDGQSYNTRYAGNYVLNVVGGKEFSLKNRNQFGLNVRVLLAGGNRYTPLDVNRSRELGFPVLDFAQTYEEQVDAYYRLDVGLSYTVNKSALTHAIRFDFQNITDRQNVQGFDYNNNFEQVAFFHSGLLPILSYKVTF